MDKLKVMEILRLCVKDACYELEHILSTEIRPYSVSVSVGVEALTFIEYNPIRDKVRYYSQTDFEENIAVNPRAEYFAILSALLDVGGLNPKASATLFKVEILANGRVKTDEIIYTVGRGI